MTASASFERNETVRVEMAGVFPLAITLLVLGSRLGFEGRTIRAVQKG